MTAQSARAEATKGVRRGNYKQIVVRFDVETFDQIAAKAKRENISMSEAIRQGVEWMLMDEVAG